MADKKLTQDELMGAIENMSVLELSQLVKDLESKFGVSAAAPMAMAAMPGAAAPVAAPWQGSRPRPGRALAAGRGARAGGA